MQFFYSATNGSDTGSVVAAVVGNEATANLSDLLPATTYTVYGVVTATNGSTPQIQNGFNSGIWSSLEGDVRTLAQQQTDTVYVVTGAILRTVTGNETITYIKPAKDTKNCPVPNYYYKVLLKVKREASGKISSASTVGVWLPHRVYSGESYQSYTKSVAEIEALTGYNFFANLPADIQAAAEQNSNWNTFASF